MKETPVWQQIIRGLLLVVAIGVAVLVLRSAAREAATRTVANLISDGKAGGVTWENCPRCGTQNQIRVGSDVKCVGCKARLAACGQCGKLLVDSEGRRDQSGKIWLCVEHHASEQWELGQLAELKQPKSLAPPPPFDRAVKARRLYDTRVATVIKRQEEPSETLLGHGKALDPTQRETLPLAVREAYQFYIRTVLEGDWGSPSVYRWDMDGKPLYIVLCTTDGDGGWVELYDGHGEVLGYAHTENYRANWTSKGKARRQVFGEPLEAVR